ncbi:uncharacterized protein FPRO_14776 [Fusarium proliferatum ET1]|uniref:Uncharacterized protein n=1 Tax=Fusarium proliferatum (strain ET1) TaxID=1227346 RepID=A0A1L7WAV3_FUSPR|nr:uncharacterized protein FPRO_14776 [Fusarium proliferatum ET1]CZR49747.1 uncharacterized protein FPRO_14776 [Fusarium proliferatum ET1]
MSATPAIRTVVGGDSTSQEAQDYIHRFRILFTALTHASKRQIRKQASFEDLKEAELHSLTRAHFELQDVHGMVCAKLALFGCEAFKAVNDLSARHVIKFARHEAEALRELTEKEDEQNEHIVALKNNVDGVVELVTLWIDAAN